MRGRLYQFAGEKSANIAIIFGLSLIPILGFAGMAVDYTRGYQMNASINNIADAAALAAVAKQSLSPGQSTAQQIVSAQNIALKAFNSQAAMSGVSVSSVSAVGTYSSGALTITVNYTASAPASFGQLFGVSQYNIGGTAVAQGGTPRYIDIYVLVDSSTSMGVGATLADQKIMANTPGMDGTNSGNGCMFACHMDGTDTLARNAGATLRFDVVQSALQQVLTQAQATMAQTQSVIRFGVYSFATNFQTEVDITANYAQIRQAVANMQLSGSHAGTNTYKALNTLRAKIGPVGDGYSQAAPLSFVILATDGTGNSTDNLTPANWIHSADFYPPYALAPAGMPFPHAVPDPANNDVMDIQGVDPAWCQQFKDMNVSVMTMVTPYIVPTPTNGGSPVDAADKRVVYIRDTLLPIIPGQMQACASDPAYYYSASSPAEIQTAMTNLLRAAVTKVARLSQ